MLNPRRDDHWQCQRHTTQPLDEALFLLPHVMTIGFLPIEYPDKTSVMRKYSWVLAWRLVDRDGNWQLIGYFRLEKDTIEDVVCRAPLAQHSQQHPCDARANFFSIQQYTDETKYAMMRIDHAGRDLSVPTDISSSLILSEMNIFQK